VHASRRRRRARRLATNLDISGIDVDTVAFTIVLGQLNVESRARSCVRRRAF